MTTSISTINACKSSTH